MIINQKRQADRSMQDQGGQRKVKRGATDQLAHLSLIVGLRANNVDPQLFAQLGHSLLNLGQGSRAITVLVVVCRRRQCSRPSQEQEQPERKV